MHTYRIIGQATDVPETLNTLQLTLQAVEPLRATPRPRWMQQKLSCMEVPSVDKGCTREKQLTLLLKQCSQIGDLEGGKRLHLNAVAAGFVESKYVASALIKMYSKCGSISHARDVFNGMIQKDVVSWNCLMLGYAENGKSSIAVDLLMCMDCQPNSVTFVAALKACSGLATQEHSQKQSCLEKGVYIHKQMKEYGLDADIVMANALIDMYRKCGTMPCAWDVFTKMRERSVVSWNCLILGYVENGDSSVAMDLIRSMDCEPDSVTYIAALKACAGQPCLQAGMCIHKLISERGFDSCILVNTTLVDMYRKCGSMLCARDTFDRMIHRNTVSWNCLILGYVENGEGLEALNMLGSMDCDPDSFTFVAALKACASIAAEGHLEKPLFLEKGMAIHRQLRFDSDKVVTTALLNMYSKCGSMECAWNVFNQMTHRNVVSWNCLILGYVENGESSIALDLFSSIDCEPDSFTYVAALKASGSLSTLLVGKSMHASICKVSLEQNEEVSNSLINFYGKCGSMPAAEHVFNSMHCQDTVSRNALIAGYSNVGDTSQVFSLAMQMQEAGLRMDSITFLCVLAAYSHSGMVEEGKKCFDSMCSYGVAPGLEHHSCIVDMLGRANRLQEALSIVDTLPFQVDNVTWTSLLPRGGTSQCWKNSLRLT